MDGYGNNLRPLLRMNDVRAYDKIDGAEGIESGEYW